MKKEANIFIIILSLIIIFPSCENSIQPLNEEKGLFSIYGYLNMREDINHIRVKELNKPLSEDTTDSIDAQVILKNLKTGQSEQLKDSVVNFDSVKTHNFRTTMKIEPDTRYRILVERSDGEQLTAMATTPYLAKRNVEPVGENCLTNIEINFEPVRTKNAIRLDIGFRYSGKIFWMQQNRNLKESNSTVLLNFTPIELLEEFSSNELQQSPSEDQVLCEDLGSDKFFVRYTHYGPNLFEEATSDTLNIPGGAGKFGAFYKDSFTIPIDTSRLCPPFC